MWCTQGGRTHSLARGITKEPIRVTAQAKGAAVAVKYRFVIRDLWTAFLTQPTAKNYLRVRQRIFSYRRRPDASELVQLAELFETGQFATLLQQARKLLPRWSLCPRFYRLTGLAALETGDQEAAQVDKLLYDCCLQGILATGDGSQSRPFWVTYTVDPDEVLDHLGQEARVRYVARGVTGTCEVVETARGTELWFSFAPIELRALGRGSTVPASILVSR